MHCAQVWQTAELAGENLLQAIAQEGVDKGEEPYRQEVRCCWGKGSVST